MKIIKLNNERAKIEMNHTEFLRFSEFIKRKNPTFEEILIFIEEIEKQERQLKRNK